LRITLTLLCTLFPYTTLSRSGDAAAARRPPGCKAPVGRRRPRRGRAPRPRGSLARRARDPLRRPCSACRGGALLFAVRRDGLPRSEEHTSELQSRENLVCRLL